jgi:hypothetical protein
MPGVGWIEPVQEQDPAVLIDDQYPRGTAVLSAVVAHAGTLYRATGEASGRRSGGGYAELPAPVITTLTFRVWTGFEQAAEVKLR